MVKLALTFNLLPMNINKLFLHEKIYYDMLIYRWYKRILLIVNKYVFLGGMIWNNPIKKANAQAAG